MKRHEVYELFLSYTKRKRELHITMPLTVLNICRPRDPASVDLYFHRTCTILREWRNQVSRTEGRLSVSSSDLTLIQGAQPFHAKR